MDMKSHEADERKIMQMIKDTLNTYQTRFVNQTQAAERDTLEKAAEAQAMFASGQISEQRYQQYLVSLKTGQDELVQDAYGTARDILKHHRHRVIEALQVCTEERDQPLSNHRRSELEPAPSRPSFQKRSDAAVLHRLNGHQTTESHISLPGEPS